MLSLTRLSDQQKQIRKLLRGAYNASNYAGFRETPRRPGAYRAQLPLTIMNQKKAKALRKALRAAGVHPRDVKQALGPSQFIPGAPGIAGVVSGSPGAMFLGHRSLAKHCGRAIYRTAKRIPIARAAA